MSTVINGYYVNSTQFYVLGDRTEEFHAGRRVELYSAPGTYNQATIVSSSLSASNTYVIIKDGVVISTLERVSYGGGRGATGSIPEHDHDGSEGEGGQISHTDIADIGINTHDEIDSHIATDHRLEEIEYFTLDATDIANKYVTLIHAPYVATEISLDLIGGCAQLYGVDYIVSDTHLSWDSLGLDGTLIIGDRIRVFYLYNV